MPPEPPQHLARTIAVVPSISSAAVGDLERLLAVLRAVRVRPVVVSNAASLTSTLSGSQIEFATSEANAGFGRSVELGADYAGDWDRMIILNDDIVLDEKKFGPAVEIIESRAQGEIIYLDPEPARRIPNSLDVFLGLALLTKLRRHVSLGPSSNARISPMAARTYKSFSAVSISRSVWDELTGFDHSLPFTYEDADFARRAEEAGLEAFELYDSGVQHHHSVSTGKHVSVVLPVAAWSAQRYLQKWSSAGPLARPICIAGLALRVLLVPLARAPKRAHLGGIRGAIRAIATGREPSLPHYKTL